MAAEATQHSAITIEVNALNNAYNCGVRHQLKGIKQLLHDANGI